jgi:nitrite reductase (NADH) small subunit
MTITASLHETDPSTPATKAVGPTQWIPICKIEDIPKQGSRVIERPQATNIALFRTVSNQVYALLDECPHKQGPLSQGIVHGEQVTCPLHAWNIQLCNGQAVAPDEGCTRQFAVKIERDLVHLDAQQLA